MAEVGTHQFKLEMHVSHTVHQSHLDTEAAVGLHRFETRMIVFTAKVFRGLQWSRRGRARVHGYPDLFLIRNGLRRNDNTRNLRTAGIDSHFAPLARQKNRLRERWEKNWQHEEDVLSSSRSC